MNIFTIVVDIPFQIPHDGAVETVTLQSTITFKELLRTIARIMEVDREEVKVGYKFSTDARTKAVNHLNSASHLRELIDDAIAHLRSLQTPAGKSKRGKSFKVEIISLIHEETRKTKQTKSDKVC